MTTPEYGRPPYEYSPQPQVRYIQPCDPHQFVCVNCGRPPGEDDKKRLAREEAEREEQRQLDARQRERQAAGQRMSDRRYRETMERWYGDDAKKLPGWLGTDKE